MTDFIPQFYDTVNLVGSNSFFCNVNNFVICIRSIRHLLLRIRETERVPKKQIDHETIVYSFRANYTKQLNRIMIMLLAHQ